MSLLDPARFAGSIFSGGWSPAEGGDYGVIEPATGKELARIGRASPGDVDRAATRALDAQRAWAAAPFEERAGVLRRAGDLIGAHAEEIIDWIVRESGSAKGKAGFEIWVATNECYEAAALPSRPYGELLVSSAPRLSMARRRPAGVVGVISPFNVPLILSIRSVAPALALGNAVILKPDPRTSVCGGAVLAEIFAQAGLPEGVFHVLPGGADVGEALVVHPAVRVISFTGSTRAGRAVGELAGRHLKRAHLELGGNSALVVLDDADLDQAVTAGAWGSFFHQGQVCMTTGRHLVHESLVGAYGEALAAKARTLPVGDPAQEDVALGPVIDEGQRDRIHSLVSASLELGAKALAGAEFDGLFYRPTVLGDVTVQMPAYAEEVFGPVAPVLSFSSLEEAAALAAASPYGLSLGILTADPLKALALAEQIPSGAVHINDQTINDEAQIPFGGVGDSGTGARFGGAEANIEAFTETQWVTMRSDIAPYPF
ncbi:MAG: benzaldehyde dehydrogenase [Actinomycetota bacterium]|nr:benzaldehyde dehydrogenase [Actinomycetota bacterium]